MNEWVTGDGWGEEGRGAFYPFQIFDILVQKGRGVTKGRKWSCLVEV